MHLFFGTRAVKHERDLFVTTMQSQFFPWERTNLKVCGCNHASDRHNKGTGKCFNCKKGECEKFKPRQETTAVQGALRPLELWEYVFPEESLPSVLAMLGINKSDADGKAIPFKANHAIWFKDKKAMAQAELKATMLRKAFGAEKIPFLPDAVKDRVIANQAVGIHPIGIKKDVRMDMPWGYNQEGL